MALTRQDYLQHLQALLPWGPAWPRAGGGSLTTLLDAMAAELARVDARGEMLTVEANPITASELLGDWERVAGLPDNCSGQLQETVQGRRLDLVSKLASVGGQSRDYFIQVAAALGFQVTIEEFQPFRVGYSHAGESLTNGPWRFAWRVRSQEMAIIRFRVGRSRVGEPLASWGIGPLECRLRKLSPAHTIPIFAYGPALNGALLLDDGSGAVLLDAAGALLLE